MNKIQIENKIASLEKTNRRYEKRCNELEAETSKLRDSMYMIIAVDKPIFAAREMRRIAAESIYNGEDER